MTLFSIEVYLIYRNFLECWPIPVIWLSHFTLKHNQKEKEACGQAHRCSQKLYCNGPKLETIQTLNRWVNV